MTLSWRKPTRGTGAAFLFVLTLFSLHWGFVAAALWLGYAVEGFLVESGKVRSLLTVWIVAAMLCLLAQLGVAEFFAAVFGSLMLVLDER